jgi:hypothetical protein
MVRLVAEGPEPNGDAKERPMPDPSAMTIRETAVAANVPAIAALQENVLVASGITSRSIMAVSVISFLPCRRRLRWEAFGGASEQFPRHSTAMPIASSWQRGTICSPADCSC